MITKFKLFESPNGLKIDNSFYNWSVDTYAFGYYEKFDFDYFLIDENITHSILARRYFRKNDIDLDPDTGRFLLYCGRLFLKPKVITFWRFPETKKILDIIRKDIEKAINIKIDDSWRVEVINFTEEELNLIDSEGFWMGGSEKLIPIDEYIGSEERNKEELKQQHVLSPMDKGKEYPKGWKPKKYKYQLPGESEVEARWRVNKYAYQENNLFEACDSLWIDENTEVEFDDENYDIYPLLYNPEIERLIIGEKNSTHGETASEYNIDRDEFESDSYNDRREWITGRIFIDFKIISFWCYPTVKEFENLINLLEQELDERIWNNGWNIEIYYGENIEGFDHVFPNSYEDYLEIFMLVPIEEYKGSSDQPEELYKQHLLSPLKKQTLKNRFPGWKPKKYKYQLPGESEVEARWRVNKYMYQESNELKGKMVDVHYKIFYQDWKEKPLTLVTDYKIERIEDNWIEVIAKGYEYVYLTSYGWAGDFKNRKKKGWVPFDDLSKDRKVIRKFPKKSVQDGIKRIKVYFYDNQV